MSLYLGSTLLAGASTNTVYNANNLLDFKWTDYILNDQSWLRADTFSWNDGTVYSTAYNHLVADNSGGTSQTETVGSYTITYVLADDGHKITTDEATVANIYAESGVAWYYVLDTANTRFKLPRENPAREELIQVIRAKGDGIALGLTNGTITAGLAANSSGTTRLMSDSSSYGVSTTTTAPSGSPNTGVFGVTTDSTKSGIISSMTDSTSVYKGHKYLYFYVGNFSQSATEQTAGLNASLFNGKADTDLNNVSAGIDFVVESYQNGTDWYRLYKSGWVEQGGYYSAPSAATATVDLLIPFQNTDYSILLTNLYNASSTKNPVHVISLSTNNFLYWCENYNGSVYWEAKGMAAQS